jgi:hypothetical protein
MSEKNFPQLPAAASVDEEIAHLSAFVESLDPDTYLAHIFRGALDWASPRIAQGSPTCLVEHLQALGGIIANHEQTNNNLSQALREQTNQTELATQRALDAKEVVGTKDWEIRKLTSQRDEAIRKVEKLELIHVYQTNEISGYRSVIRKKEGELADAEQEILRLKAEIYDRFLVERDKAPF